MIMQGDDSYSCYMQGLSMRRACAYHVSGSHRGILRYLQPQKEMRVGCGEAVNTCAGTILRWQKWTNCNQQQTPGNDLDDCRAASCKRRCNLQPQVFVMYVKAHKRL